MKKGNNENKFILWNAIIYIIILTTYILAFKFGLNNNLALGILLLMGVVQLYIIFKLYKSSDGVGGEREKVLNLRVIKIIPENNLVVVKGSVPGATGSYVILEV